MTPDDTLEPLEWAPPAVRAGLQAVAADLPRAYAANTLHAWRASWRLWSAFCARTGHPLLPASLEALRAFLMERIALGRKRATLAGDLATLATVHRLSASPWPLDTLAGRLMWRGLRREYLPARQRQAQGLQREKLDRLLAPLATNDPRAVRDAALICVAYETLCRRSELVALQVEQIEREPDGTGRLVVARSKTDQEGEGAILFLSGETMQRVTRWCELAGIERGPVFRSIPVPRLDKRPRDPAIVMAERYSTPLTAGDVARIYKRRARAVGLDPTRISGHSTRVGATQDLLAANISGALIMLQGRWKTERMVVSYGQRLAAGLSAMAQLRAAQAASASPDSDPDPPAGPR